MLVLEQLVDHVERLALRHFEKVAADGSARQQPVALLLRQRLGIALRQQNAAGDLLGLAVPLAEGRRVLFRETRHIGDSLFEVAPENERRAVAMGLAEFIARRDVGDLVGEPEIGEPRRVADVEMIDRMQVVIEAGLGDFACAKPTAVVEPSVDQQHIEAALRQIRARGSGRGARRR